MSDTENLLVKYCVGTKTGTALGGVKNKKSTWAKFAAMFDRDNILVDTSTTFAKYVALDSDAKLIKKSAPGNWLAAHFNDGRRKLVCQVARYFIVFDIDNVTPDQLEHILSDECEINQFLWLGHTTRAHCPEKPRVRMMLPVSRGMDATETNAITRLLSLQLAEDPDEAIEIPDLVSFRYNQTMFLPSISKGQDYWVRESAGEVLDVDAFLAENPGWDDFTFLPYQEAEKARAIADPSRRMEDPREKKGIIGAWCRTYSVEEVIAEFLPDIYVPGDSSTETRYTYTLGTGSNGAVVYDGGLFLHSNHGSDPIQGQANAFDLARNHLFGHLDKDARTDTSPGNLPSYKAMVEFAKKDPKVSAEEFSALVDEFDWDDEDDDDEDESEKDTHFSDIDDLLGPAPKPKKSEPSVADLLGDTDDDDAEYDIADEFDDYPEDDEPEEKPKKKKADTSWTLNLRRKANNDIEPVFQNAALICLNDPRLANKIAFNEFSKDPQALGQIKMKQMPLPTNPVLKKDGEFGREWQENEDIAIRLLCSVPIERGGYGVDFPKALIQDAVLAAGMVNKIHPPKAFVEKCHKRWLEEGSPTGFIEQIAQRYLGCPDTPFHRESSRMLPIAAVCRLWEPGCKYDQLTVIQGVQGSRKSTFWRIFFNNYFGELSKQFDKPDRMIESMRAKWGLEFGELAAAKKQENEDVKEFLAKQDDRHRLAYASRVENYKRQCVFVSSTNNDDYLSDPTGLRRFWVWHTTRTRAKPTDTAHLKANLWRIFGEAYQAYLDMRAAQPYGDLWLDLVSQEAIEEAEEIAQGSRKQSATEAISEVIEEWLDRRVGIEETRNTVSDPLDAQFDDDEDAGGVRFYRNMVTGAMAYEALSGEKIMSAYRNATPATYGKALKLIKGWTAMSKCRRHGAQAVWFHRVEDGPMWVEAPEEQADDGLPAAVEEANIDDLLG